MIKMITNHGGLYRITQPEATANRFYGGIDLGSNTFRLLIAGVHNGRIEPVVKRMHTVRLAEGLHNTGRICEPALQRAKEALADFRSLLDLHQPTTVRACGTAALRIAGNRKQFLRQAASILGIAAEVIDGGQEARLSGTGAFATMQQRPPSPLLLADIGGGSSELLVAADTPTGPEITAAVSLPLGAVNLSETFLRAALPSANELAAMAAHVEAAIIPAIAAMAPLPKTVVGIGGSATALAALDCNLSDYDSERIQDHLLPRATLEALLVQLSRCSGAERNRLPGLNGRRGEIILGGLLIFLTLLKVLPASGMIVSDGGLLEGILLSVAAANDKIP